MKKQYILIGAIIGVWVVAVVSYGVALGIFSALGFTSSTTIHLLGGGVSDIPLANRLARATSAIAMLGMYLLYIRWDLFQYLRER